VTGQATRTGRSTPTSCRRSSRCPPTWWPPSRSASCSAECPGDTPLWCRCAPPEHFNQLLGDLRVVRATLDHGAAGPVLLLYVHTW